MYRSGGGAANQAGFARVGARVTLKFAGNLKLLQKHEVCWKKKKGHTKGHSSIPQYCPDNQK